MPDPEKGQNRLLIKDRAICKKCDLAKKGEKRKAEFR